MAVAFAGIAFRVLTESGDLPYPAADESGVWSYAANIRLDARADVLDLAALRSRISTNPALGFASGGTVIVEGGPGASALVLPLPLGGEETWTAVLVDCVPLAFLGQATFWRVAARWVLLERTA